MTHENLTPYEAMPYSVNRNMEGNGEQQPGGSRPQAPQGSEIKVNRHPKNPVERHGSPPTPEQIEAAKKYWEQKIVNTKDPGEREMFRHLAEMGVPPMGGGAEVLPITEYGADPALEPLVRGINNQINSLLDQSKPPILDLRYIEGQIDRLERLIDERRVANMPLALRLQTKLGEFRAETLKAEADARAEAQERGTRGARREGREQTGQVPTLDDVNEMIDRAPDVGGSRFPPEVMEAALLYPETTDRLINRILFKSFEDTTDANRYEINLYAQDNLEQLLGGLGRVNREKYDYFVKLKTAAELFHSMNSTLVGGKLEDFIRISANINYEHFSLFQQITGLPDVMRIYEEKYLEILARDGTISTEGYRDLIVRVGEDFKALNEANLLKSSYAEGRTAANPSRLQEWELARALNAGRAFFNITFRAAEQIASGQVPGGAKRWAGFPQEDAVRLMNWAQWLVYRFNVSPERGGQEFLERTKRNTMEFNLEKGRKLNINRLEELGGMNIDSLEAGGMFGVSGVYSSWRNETMLFDRLPVNIDGRHITLRTWLDESIQYGGNGDQKKRSEWIDQIRKGGNANELLTFLTPVIEGNNLAMGVLIKQGMFSEKVGYDARRRMWERIADTNLPLMISYLSRVKLQGEEGPARDLARPDGPEWDDNHWNDFKRRIMIRHARQTKIAAMPMIPEDQRPEIPPEQEFTQPELDEIRRISNRGIELAPQFADILFPYTPFMNDVPFDLLDYAGPGESFYKRRSGGDLPSFSAAERAFTALVGNPGGIGAEEALKQFGEIVKGIESPQGTGDAQERVFPMFSAWAEFSMTTTGRQAVVKEINKFLRRPTSLGQEYAGLEADSFSETEILHILGQAQKQGILNPALYNEMKKKKHLGLAWMLWVLFRDIGPILPIILAYQVGKPILKAA